MSDPFESTDGAMLDIEAEGELTARQRLNEDMAAFLADIEGVDLRQPGSPPGAAWLIDAVKRALELAQTDRDALRADDVLELCAWCVKGGEYRASTRAEFGDDPYIDLRARLVELLRRLATDLRRRPTLRPLSVGQRISALRRAAHLSQEDVAEFAGVTTRTVSRWEHDELPPSWAHRVRLGQLFHCPATDFEGKAIQ